METAGSVRHAFDLTGRVALVTGAGSGIGRTTAEVLAGAGATVVCADIDPARAAETARAIVDEQGKAESAQIDVSQRGAAETLVGHIVARHGGLHVMCNIAGIMIDSSIIDLDPDEFDRILGVNLKGVLYGCQAAGKAMVAQGGGSIINMSLDGGPGSLTRHRALRHLQGRRGPADQVDGRRGGQARGAGELHRARFRTHQHYGAALHGREDGTIDEAMKEAVLSPMARHVPLRRVGLTTDIAYCVLYLASDASSYVTGQLISPNGGASMHY